MSLATQPPDGPTLSKQRLICATMAIAVATQLARHSSGQSIFPAWIEIGLQLPTIVCWIMWRCRGPQAALNTRFIVAALIVGSICAVRSGSISPLFLCTTCFMAGSLLMDRIAVLYARLELAQDDAMLAAKSVVRAWAIVVIVTTLLLSLPLATASGVPDYRHNFWLHVVTCGHAATSACCLVGTTIYGFGEDFTSFGKTVLIVVNQFSAIAFLCLGCIVLRQLTGSRVSLRRVIATYVTLIVAASVALYPSWSQSDAPTAGRRFLWSIASAGGALADTGFLLRPDGFASYVGDRAVFFVLTTCAIISSLGIPILLELVSSVFDRSRRGEIVNAQFPWRPIAQWEAGAALALLVIGAVLIFLFESPRFLSDTLFPPRPLDFGGNLVPLQDIAANGSRWSMAVFVSSTLRSAGLQSIPVAPGGLSWLSFGVMLAWMAVGGSMAGLAGGVRTGAITLFALVILPTDGDAAKSAEMKRTRRSLAARLLLMATAWMIWNLLSIGALAAVSDGTWYELVFESVAAANGVALSTGLTLHLTWACRLLMIFIMVAGRWLPIVLWAALCSAASSAVRRSPELT
jgi:trk system potassium uptake protein TrkH